jgi:deoxyribonucleoside regulator
MVKQARQSGLVKITIASDASPYAELEQEMMERFGLTEVIIVPSPSADAGNLRSLLALGTVTYITRVIRDDMTVAVGLSRTIGEAARLALAGTQVRRSTVFVSLVGALREGGVGGDSPFGASALLAQAFGGAVEHLHAPIIVRSEAVAQELMNDPAIAQSLERAEGELIGLICQVRATWNHTSGTNLELPAWSETCAPDSLTKMGKQCNTT